MPEPATGPRSEPETGGRGDHGCSPVMDRVDDLGVVDALQVGRGDAEIAVAELALDHVQRHALAGHLDRMCVTELVRCEPAPHSRSGGEPAQLGPDAGLRPGPPAGRAVDDAEQRPRCQLKPLRGPGAQVFPAPVVHRDLAAMAALAAADKERAAAPVEVALVELERLLDPEPGPPQNDDQPADAV